MSASETGLETPLVALVGRPNVGKSALFNRMTRRGSALVEALPGTTRDRNYDEFEWRGQFVRVVDTGGLANADSDPFAGLVREGVEQAIAESDAILFVVDAAAGPTADDNEIASLLRRARQPVILVANKSDLSAAQERLFEFYALGLGEPLAVSGYHGRGIGELLDAVVEVVAPAERPPDSDRIAIAIVGRPNVGKSSLANAMLGEQRSIVSDVPGTTRDTIDTPFEFEGRGMLLVDTAGLRRRGKRAPGVERHAAQRAERAIDRADVVLLVIDQSEPRAAQDTHIAGYVAERARGLALVVNKWDLATDRSGRADFARQVDYRYRFVPWASVQFTSAITGEGVRDLLELAVHINEVRQRRVQTSELNRVLQRAMQEHAPRTVGNRNLRLMYATQAAIAPPTFVLFVNDPALLHFAYRRYLENRIREAFDFEGTGIELVFRHRSEDRHEANG